MVDYMSLVQTSLNVYFSSTFRKVFKRKTRHQNNHTATRINKEDSQNLLSANWLITLVSKTKDCQPSKKGKVGRNNIKRRIGIKAMQPANCNAKFY